jgi:serine/threonine protein kinase
MSEAPGPSPQQLSSDTAEKSRPTVNLGPIPVWITPAKPTPAWSAEAAEELLQSSLDGDRDSAACADTVPQLPAPTSAESRGRLGHYRILQQLGTGGMGTVFLAEDTQLGRLVALKVLRPNRTNPESVQRFLREARATAAIHHDHVVTIYQVGEERGLPYLAMELLKGMTLDAWLKKGHVPSLAQILRVGCDTAMGLAAAHRNGLIHRDIKPANLWLQAPNGRVKILDFGLARPFVRDTGLTTVGMVLGTPAFMAPEQAFGLAIDARCDLFSLGVVLHRLCTGQFPFQAPDAVSLLKAIVETNRIPVHQLKPDLPRGLSDLIARLLSKDPADRPSSAEEVVEALRKLERERKERLAVPPPLTISAPVKVLSEAIGDLPRLLPQKPRNSRSSHGRLVALVGSLCCLAILALVVYIIRSEPSIKPVAKKPDEPAQLEPDPVLAELAAMRQAVAAANGANDLANLTMHVQGLLRFHDKNIKSDNPKLREAAALARELATLLDKTKGAASPEL